MANYQSLKTAINAVIKANGNKEITGTVLNEVLLAMVNSLGAGYQFAGVATPSTNPGTPDQKVFYIASQAGTYTNFNGAVVSDGIAIFEWNDTWNIEILTEIVKQSELAELVRAIENKQDKLVSGQNIKTINGFSILGAGNVQIEGGGGSISIDPTPTNGSPNAVASGGVYNALKAITDFLNNGYYFVGIAGTSTVPDSVTQYGIFYIASDGGTYTNFLNGDDEPLTLYQGLNILYKDIEDDGWNYFEVFKFSDFVDTTRQQSLSTQQKAQARTNIAAVSYDAQSLSADQQVQAQNNVMGKTYNAAQFSGLGKKVLAKNIQTVSGVQKNVMTQDFFQDGQGNALTNTIFVIQYDYTLGGNITIPAGCTLEFDGGSINNGTIIGNNTTIKADRVAIFSGITILGTWNVTDIHSSWFADATSNNVLKEVLKLMSNDRHNNIYIESGTYNVSALSDTRETILDFNKKDTDVYCNGKIVLAPNGFWGYTIVMLSADDVHFYGGVIEGDAVGHDYSTHQSDDDNRKTHEWGQGIAITGNNCIVDGADSSLCTGDSMVIKNGATNSVARNITLSKSRRQGLTLATCSSCTVENFDIKTIGDFTYDGHTVTGTLPKSCIDIEPDANGVCTDCVLRNGYLENNVDCLIAPELNGATITDIFVENVKIKNTSSKAGLQWRGTGNLSVNNVSIEKGGVYVAGGKILIENCEFNGECDFVETTAKVRNSKYKNIVTRESNLRFDNCDATYIQIKQSTDKTVEFNECYLHTDVTVPINIINTTSTVELTIKKSKIDYYNNNGTVGSIGLRGSGTCTIEDSELYMKGTGLYNILSFNYEGNLLVKDTKSYKYDVNSYVSNDVKLTDVNKATAIYTAPEYVSGTVRPQLPSAAVGHKFFDENLKKPITWTADRTRGADGWVEANGDIPNDARKSGTIAQRPQIVNIPYVGYQLFVTTAFSVGGVDYPIGMYIYADNDNWLTPNGTIVSDSSLPGRSDAPVAGAMRVVNSVSENATVGTNAFKIYMTEETTIYTNDGSHSIQFSTSTSDSDALPAIGYTNELTIPANTEKLVIIDNVDTSIVIPNKNKIRTFSARAETDVLRNYEIKDADNLNALTFFVCPGIKLSEILDLSTSTNLFTFALGGRTIQGGVDVDTVNSNIRRIVLHNSASVGDACNLVKRMIETRSAAPEGAGFIYTQCTGDIETFIPAMKAAAVYAMNISVSSQMKWNDTNFSNANVRLESEDNGATYKLINRGTSALMGTYNTSTGTWTVA